ncbi:MAG TPA: hypothetical protein VNJ70_01920 [Thermoanaerobaculia bacterium]|nr:hypothetical protein [Thermoanaerobaculia bacterium]
MTAIPTRLPFTGFLLLLALAAPAAADVEETLNARWRGAWVVVEVPVQSDCAGVYTDNDVSGRRVQSRGARRFAAGELARVERIGVKRARLDLFLDVAEPVLEPHREGPFTLYEEKRCKAQLKVELPPEVVRDAARAEAAVIALLELHPSPEAAEAAAGWNRRRREPYPEDYERTLAEHAAWKATQVNTEVQERIERATEEGTRLADRIDDDPEYLQGFAAGVERARDKYLSDDCESLLDGSFNSFSGSPPGGKDRDWERGFEDGQRLVYSLELLRRLPRCFVLVPPAP